MLLYRNVLKNCLIPIITRVVFSIPLIVISGALIVESYFGIPGVGKVTFDAITTGEVRWETGQPSSRADAVLWTIGRVRPNTGWLPAELLDGSSNVIATANMGWREARPVRSLISSTIPSLRRMARITAKVPSVMTI